MPFAAGARRALRATASLSGRVAGILVTVAVIRILGVSQASTTVLLALAFYAFASSVALSLGESYGSAMYVERRGTSAWTFSVAGLVAGSILAGLVAVATGLFVPVVDVLASSFPLIAALMLGIPFTGMFATNLGVSVIDGRHGHMSVASWTRVAVILGLVVPFLSTSTLWVVAVAYPLGDVVRALMSQAVIGFGGRGVDFVLVRRLVTQMAAHAPSSAAGSANPFLDRFMTASLGLGSLAILDLAEKAYSAVALAFTQGLLPELNRSLLAQPPAAQARLVRIWAAKAAALGVVLACCSALAIVVVAPWVLGPAAAADAPSLATTSAIYLVGLPAYLAGQVLVRGLIARSKGHYLNLTATIALIVNAALDIVLGLAWGLNGIAAATAAVTWCSTGLAFAALRRAERVTR